jgi:hypothetical protein
MKVIQVGPEGIHLSNYCSSIFPLIGEFGYIGESACNISGTNSSLVAPFRGSNIFNWIQSYFKILKYLKNEKPDILHIHQVNRLAFFVCLAAQRINIPVIQSFIDGSRKYLTDFQLKLREFSFHIQDLFVIYYSYELKLIFVFA